MSTGPKIIGAYLEPIKNDKPGYIIIRDDITPDKVKKIKAAWERQFKGYPKAEVRMIEGEYDTADALIAAIEKAIEG